MILPEEETGEIREPSNTASLDREVILHFFFRFCAVEHKVSYLMLVVLPLLLGEFCCFIISLYTNLINLFIV